MCWFLPLLLIVASSVLAYRSSGVLWWTTKSHRRSEFCVAMNLNCRNDILATFASECPCDFGERELSLDRGEELCLRYRSSPEGGGFLMDVYLNGDLAWSMESMRSCYLCIRRTFK